MSEIDLTIPAFLDRKKNPSPPATLEERRAYAGSVKPINEEEELVASAWAEGEKQAIRERFAERRAAAKVAKEEAKRLEAAGVRIRLNIAMKDCPLPPGEHTVELVYCKRKRVKFRVPGRKNCVRVPRPVWDSLVVKESNDVPRVDENA